MVYNDLMTYYKMSADLTTGEHKYVSLTEFENMIPFERDLMIEMILQRKQKEDTGATYNADSDVVTQFDEV